VLHRLQICKVAGTVCYRAIQPTNHYHTAGSASPAHGWRTHGGGNDVKVLGAGVVFGDGGEERPRLLVGVDRLERPPAEREVRAR
jgi:hypothetical protein